jgi:prolyl-tRNA synthetase
MYAAYCRIFERCALEYLPVEAESGPIGGDASHEFMVPAENGEDTVLHCFECGYAANQEKAEIGARDTVRPDVPMEQLATVDTPGASTIEQVSAVLAIEPRQLIKTLIYMADGKPVAVLVRGDHEANEGKIRRSIGAERLELAEPDVIQQVTGAPVGFAGPVGMAQEIPIHADRDVRAMVNAATGANAGDKHLTGVNPDRDFTVTQFADLRNALDRDPCPRCSAKLTERYAVEAGHVFKLGTKYSEALAARFLDDKEQQQTIIMGCYGIGVNRLLAATIETSHDEHGIVWPVSLAPYEVLLVPMKPDDEQTAAVVDDLTGQLTAAGVEVLTDDRPARAGVKFNDADLIGVPLRVVIGPRGLKDGKLEAKWRWDKDAELLDLDNAAETIADWITGERRDGARFRAAMRRRR